MRVQIQSNNRYLTSGQIQQRNLLLQRCAPNIAPAEGGRCFRCCMFQNQRALGVRWAGNLGNRYDLKFNNRARKALSLLLVPVNDGDEQGTPVTAESLFDQMEIYPGMYVSSGRVGAVCNAEQGLKRSIFASCMKRQGYHTLKWSVWRTLFFPPI